MISCLTVTREVRLASLRRAVGDYARQTWPERELVIVHDGGAAFDEELHALAAAHAGAAIVVHREAGPRTLGELRNASIAAASGDIVCQWDDDDRYHPRRLELQLAAMRVENSDFCFLTDQLHLFAADGTMFWDDWNLEVHPLNLVQGTLLGRRAALGRYPPLARGEDTPLVLDLLRRGCRITRLREHGFLYVYVFDGRNAWDREHHAAISAWKRFRGARLLAFEPTLRARLAEYDPPLGRCVMPYDGGELVFEDA
ncbi:MAG: glycosyltransferase family 2 protein [Casimicrobiaceae bacterium]